MSSNTPPRPRKLPKQRRSQVLVDAIQESCLQILKKDGPEQLTTQNIADVAGVNIASVYQYFPNKEAVLASVYEKELQSLARLSAQRFAELHVLATHSLKQTLAAIIELEADQLLALYELNPEFFTQYSLNYDVHGRVNELTQSFDNPSWEEWFIEFLTLHKSKLRSAPVQSLSFFARSTMRGVFQAAIDEQPSLLGDNNFRQELLRVLVAYLIE